MRKKIGSEADGPWKLNDYHEGFLEKLAEMTEGVDLSEEDLDEIFQNSFDEAQITIADSLEKELLRRRPKMLRERRRLHRGFVSRNTKRWKRGFDAFEQIIVMSEELGAAITADVGKEAVQKNDPQFEAIIANHARSILIAREAFSLLCNGYPDGAMGRWRTLHEIIVIMQFLSHSEPEVAERYLVSRHVKAWRYARNYMKHHVRANLEPYSDDELASLKVYSEEVLKRYGPELDSDYGWAWPKIKAKRPTFAQIEEATGLDHWRPRYQWASVNTHGPYRAPVEGLGVVESQTPVRLVGPSNSGMIDPTHMLAISLNLSNASLVAIAPNLDRIALIRIMIRLSDRLGDDMVEDQRTSYQAATQRRDRVLNRIARKLGLKLRLPNV